jgi:chitodextrinase
MPTPGRVSYTRSRTSLVLLLALLGSSPSAMAVPVAWTHLSSANGDLEPPSTSGRQQTAAQIFDIDLDGVNDFVIITRRRDKSVVWYRRDATGWTKQPVDDTILGIEAGGAFHDIDQDGDVDLVMGAESTSNEVWWWENPYPIFDGTPWTRRNIKSTGATKHHDMMFGDFDDDGAVELVFWNQGDNFSLKMAEIPADPTAPGDWPTTTIFVSPSNAEGLYPADIDGDGLVDIVGGGQWLKHTGGTTFVAMPVDLQQTFTRVAAGQLVPGGRPEIVLVAGDGSGPLQWYEWDGVGWVAHQLLGFDVDSGHSLEIADFDGDGNLDIFVAEMILGTNTDAKVWIFYGDGAGTFLTTEVATGFDNHESKVGDLDGDGDADILGKPFDNGTPGVNIWLNDRVPIGPWQRHVIDGALPGRCIFVNSGDMDGDTDEDLVCGAGWWENPGTLDGSWVSHTVGAPMNNMALVHDFDNDGDLDIFGTDGDFKGDVMSWAENDGGGNFTVHNLGSAGAGIKNFPQGAVGAVLDPGGPFQVLISWHDGSPGVQAFTVPADPVNDPWPVEILHTNSQGEDLTAIDLDNDDDLDIYQGTQWLRNDGGSWTPFVIQDTSALGLPDRHRVADMDGDGDLDAVVGFETDTSTAVIWLESPVDPEQLWTLHTIDPAVGGGYSLDVADLDGDGDYDVSLGEHKGATRMLVYENLGAGASWGTHLVDPGGPDIDHHDGAIFSDVDGDGDLDILSTGFFNLKLFVFENQSIDSGSPPPPPAMDTTPPTIPTQLSGVPLSGTRIAIQWEASTDDVAVAGYDVTRDGVVVASVVGTSYTDTALFPGIAYPYTVIAVDTSGNVSAASNEIMIATLNGTPPADPSLLASYGFEGTGAVVSDVSGNGNDGTLVANASRAAGGFFGQTSLFDGVAGHVDLAGLDIPGSELTIMLWCNPASFSTSDARMISKATGIAEADHFWMLSTFNGSRIRVRLRSAGSTSTLVGPNGSLVVGQWSHVAFTYDGAQLLAYHNGTQVGSLAQTGALETDSAVLATIGDNPGGGRPFDGSIDEVRIFTRALDPTEIQLYSGLPVVLPPSDTQPPTMPTGPLAVALAPDRVQFTWAASTDDTAVEGYRIFRDASLVASVVGVTEFEDTGLAGDTAYDYSVAAFDDAGNLSAPSGTVTVTTPILDAEAPTAPVVMADATSETTAMISWTLSSDNVGVSGYRVRRDGMDLVTVGPAVVDYSDSGLQAVTAYSYDVVAFDAAGNEAASTPVVVNTPDLTPPGAPTGLAASVLSARSVQLDWEAALPEDGVTGYQVGRDGTVIETLGVVVQFIDQNLRPMTLYDYEVTAFDAAGNDSAPSATVSVSMPAVNITALEFSNSFTAPSPNGIAFDAFDGTLYTVDGTQGEVCHLTPAGLVIGCFAHTQPGLPMGIDVLPGGNVAVVDEMDLSMTEYTPAGAFVATSLLPAGNAPSGVVFHEDSLSFFNADRLSESIYEFADETLLGVVDTSGIPSTAPKGIDFDPVTGNLYVVDDVSGMLYEIALSGIPVSEWDLVALTGFFDPEGVAYDPATHSFYVSFDDDNTVAVLIPEPNTALSRLCGFALLGLLWRLRASNRRG